MWYSQQNRSNENTEKLGQLLLKLFNVSGINIDNTLLIYPQKCRSVYYSRSEHTLITTMYTNNILRLPIKKIMIYEEETTPIFVQTRQTTESLSDSSFKTFLKFIK